MAPAKEEPPLPHRTGHGATTTYSQSDKYGNGGRTRLQKEVVKISAIILS